MADGLRRAEVVMLYVGTVGSCVFGLGLLRPPPMPEWEAVHPIVVHFPVALLLFAPVLFVAGGAWARGRWGLWAGGWLLWVAGTIGACLAVASGEATAEAVAPVSGAVDGLIERHEEAGELARSLFVGVTLLTGGALGVGYASGRAARRRLRAWAAGLGVAAGLAYSASALVLANAAHMGGQLVHVYGVRAPMPPTATGDIGVLRRADRTSDRQEDHMDDE